MNMNEYTKLNHAVAGSALQLLLAVNDESLRRFHESVAAVNEVRFEQFDEGSTEDLCDALDALVDLLPADSELRPIITRAVIDLS